MRNQKFKIKIKPKDYLIAYAYLLPATLFGSFAISNLSDARAFYRGNDPYYVESTLDNSEFNPTVKQRVLRGSLSGLNGSLSGVLSLYFLGAGLRKLNEK